MFFYVGKIAWFVLQPSSLLVLLFVAGVLLLWTRFARAGRRMVLSATILLVVGGLSPLGHAVMLPLENRFPAADLERGRKLTGIVVLGGSLDMLVSTSRERFALTEAGERLVETALLARQFPDARIVVSGGGGGLLYERASEARTAVDLLVKLGIARDRLILEERSRNTYQNAVEARDLVRPGPAQRWLLVTSANHMPRAIGSFRRAGFPIEAWPVDYRTRGRADLTRFFSKPSSGLRRLDIATRQWAGLFAYWATGRSDALFPAP